MRRSGIRFSWSSRQAGLLLVVGLVPACGSGGGGGALGIVGEELANPEGGYFIVDPSSGGGATRLHLAEAFWGRLVDVHDVDADGVPSPSPVFRDFPVNESIQTDGDKYLLTANPITQRVRLVIRRPHGAPDDGRGTFTQLLRQAELGLAPIVPKGDDGNASAPFSFVARNAALVLRFDDLLQDDDQALRDLPETVRLLVGYPPVTPFVARIFFDRNHGGLAGGRFHSTRVIVDCSVSEVEAAAFPIPLALNSDGLPASLTTSPRPNVSIRIPTRLSFGTGQFSLLRGLSGVPLAENENGPMDRDSPAREIVRAMRAGNPIDANNGFLLDFNAPAIVGGWPIQVERATPDPDGLPGLDWSVDILFRTPCRAAPVEGDICSVAGTFLEVRRLAGAPDVESRVRGVKLRALLDEPLRSPSALLGQGELLTRFDDQKPVESGCWVSFTPPPRDLPQDEVAPEAQIVVRFTEPMDPDSVTALESLLLVRGDNSIQPSASTLVVGEVSASSDLRRFTLKPTLPLRHLGRRELYHLRFGPVTDLAGNGLPDAPSDVTFSIDPSAPARLNGGLVARFNAVEELDPAEGADFRGQFFYDFTRGRIRPREVSLQSTSADRNNPVPSIMIPFPPGVQTPLAPLGSKLQTVYRYCDLGWTVRDETKYNLDVIGLAWSPIGGQVISDFYENFEIRLAHSRYLPDECIHNRFLTPLYPGSGLVGSPRPFVENILSDVLSPQKVVHTRSLGYAFSQADLFLAPSGTAFMPYPLNRGAGEITSYTWRDTAVLARAAPNGAGIPLCIETSRALMLEDAFGTIAGPGEVPSFGLPLLVEIRCYPSDDAVGLNPLDISLAVNSSALPAFRAYSTGGINRFGAAVTVDPDLEEIPLGGFNPNSSPPGRRTPLTAENAFYIGHLDYVARISRAHSAWLDTLDASPDYVRPVVQPRSDKQPLGTRIALEYRGATSFNGTEVRPFDARTLNAYGEPVNDAGMPLVNVVRFHNNVRTWKDDVDAVDGARYLQLRLSFHSRIETGLSPELDALGIAFSLD